MEVLDIRTTRSLENMWQINTNKIIIFNLIALSTTCKIGFRLVSLALGSKRGATLDICLVRGYSEYK